MCSKADERQQKDVISNIARKEVISVANIIWTPQPKQVEFMSRPEFEVLYGGAAGGR